MKNTGKITRQSATLGVYKPFSIYPFILRDIALFAEEGKEKEILTIIKTEAGPLLFRADLFDVFTKDGKTSYTSISYSNRRKNPL